MEVLHWLPTLCVPVYQTAIDCTEYLLALFKPQIHVDHESFHHQVMGICAHEICTGHIVETFGGQRIRQKNVLASFKFDDDRYQSHTYHAICNVWQV